MITLIVAVIGIYNWDREFPMFLKYVESNTSFYMTLHVQVGS